MSMGFGGIDFNDPRSFQHLLGSHLPIPEAISPAEVRRQARNRRDNVLSSYKKLNDILSRHEATIQKRWAKKSKTARTKLLLDCWPGMAKSHRPDYAAYREERPQPGRGTTTKYRDSYLWPNINQEDLSGPRAFLVLLNARGRNHPSKFACADGESFHLGIVSTVIVPLFLNEYTMMLNDVEDDRYGQLLSWDDHPDAFNWMHELQQFNPGEGLLVLEIQERVLGFLVKCCKALFYDIPPEKFLSEEYPPQPMPELKPPAETDVADSRALMREEEAYRLPARLNMSRVTTVLQAQAEAAADHFWLLREDPGYFADELLDAKDHRQEMMKDTRGEAHPILSPQRQDTFWSRVISASLTQDYASLEFSAELAHQAGVVKALMDKRTPTSSRDELPNDLLVAFLTFRHHLTECAKWIRGVLKSEFPGSPPMRGLYERLPPPDPHTPMIRLQSKPHAMSDDENYFNYLMTLLWDDQQIFLFRLPMLMDEIDRHLPAVRNIISPRVAKLIGSLSIVAQCLREIEQFHPWARSFEMKSPEHDKAIEKSYAKWISPLQGILKAITANSPKLISLVSNPKERFEYPPDKRETKDVVDTKRASEQKLDRFWSITDTHISKSCGNLEGTAFASLFTRELRRTGYWVEPPAKTKAPICVEVLHKPLSELTLVSDRSTEPYRAEERRVKVKTRGVAQLPDSGSTAGKLDSEDSEATQIGVDARALKTFRNLFFNPNVSATPEEIPWKEFRHAMNAAGFEPHKLYGSAWQFQSPASTLVFHEPHPNPKIPIRQARRMGRRLSRAFGWDVDTFVLQDKSNGA